MSKIVGAPNIRIDFKSGEPRHICHVALGRGPAATAYIVKDLLDQEKRRETVLVSDQGFLRLIPKESQRVVEQLRTELIDTAKNMNIGLVSAHKKLCNRLARDDQLPDAIKVVCHVYGSVISHVIGLDSKNRFQVCVFPHIEEGERDSNANLGLQIRLDNYYDLGLTDMLSQYLGEATFNMESILKSSSHDMGLRYCRKIREDLGKSFGPKINDVFKGGLNSYDAQIREKANKIISRYDSDKTLEMLRFCRDFMMLLVNYYCGFLKRHSEVDRYRKRLDDYVAKAREGDLSESESYGALIDTYQRLESCDAEISIPTVGLYDEWLPTLFWAARKIQFVKKVQPNVDFSEVNIFFAHHMRVPSACNFLNQLRLTLQNGLFPNVRILVGWEEHPMDNIIHEMVDAKILLSDALVAYFPTNCADFYGEKVTDHEWIIKESLEAMMLDKPVYSVVEIPSHFDFQEFGRQIDRYASGLRKSAPVIGESFLNKLNDCVERFKWEISNRTRVECTPSYRLDKRAIDALGGIFTKIVERKCLTFVKMTRLSYRREDWYPFIHIHRLSKSGRFVGIEEIAESLRKDELAPAECVNHRRLRLLITRSYREPLTEIDGRAYALIEVDSGGRVRSMLYQMILLLQGKYRISSVLTGQIDSLVEKTIIL